MQLCDCRSSDMENIKKKSPQIVTVKLKSLNYSLFELLKDEIYLCFSS